MIALLTGLLVMLQVSAGPARDASLTPRLTDRAGILDCTMALSRQIIDRRVEVSCTLDTEGRPTRCNVSQPDLSSKEKRAAICLARLYRMEGDDGRIVTNQTVAIPISLRMNVAPPPPGFTPPGS